MTATLANTGTSKSIESLALTLFKIRFGTSSKVSTATVTTVEDKNIDNMPFVFADADSVEMALSSSEACAPALFALSTSDKAFHSVKITSASRRASDFINADVSTVKPGESETYSAVLSFVPSGTSRDEVLKSLYARRSALAPAQLVWNDRRPIGSIFLANSNTKFKTNPRGWFNDSKLNVKTTEGLAAFRKKMLTTADSAVKNLKNVGAQGMIFWDLEGEEMPHPVSYIGDPRMLPTMASEMDSVADEFFARFSKAGLKTGVTLRPSRIQASGSGWKHNHMAFDPVEEISQKIDYAQQRWGCSIFYVDSNATYAYNAKREVISWVMRAYMFQELQARHPDVLIIPEHGTYDYWSATAPYGELDMGDTGTADKVRWSYPDAFSVINISDGNIGKYRKQLVNSVKGGDVLLFRCWFNDGTHNDVKSIYDEADRDAVGTPQNNSSDTAPSSSAA
ncbi:MAG: hypothetical protein EOO38_15285 [Cytophagaceae bacterium]|nr:MAG: hypothetical protein EOO38_15285 [Cytophagaceae bacterium]